MRNLLSSKLVDQRIEVKMTFAVIVFWKFVLYKIKHSFSFHIACRLIKVENGRDKRSSTKKDFSGVSLVSV
jgi:hypothetical protein